MPRLKKFVTSADGIAIGGMADGIGIRGATGRTTAITTIIGLTGTTGLIGIIRIVTCIGDGDARSV